jgi:hypothetical protein
VIVEVREELHETYVVPAHAYGWLVEARSPSGPGWVISTVDQRCNLIASWPVDGDHNLLYIGVTAQVKLTKGDAYAFGLRTARPVVLVTKSPPCPDFAGSVVNDSDQPVVLDEFGLVHQTWLVPPHAWGFLTSFPSPPGPGWKLDLVDEACKILGSWTIESAHVLLHITSDGRVEFTADTPLVGAQDSTASPSDLVARTQACL